MEDMGDMEMDMESMMGGGDSKVKSSDGSNVEFEVRLDKLLYGMEANISCGADDTAHE